MQDVRVNKNGSNTAPAPVPLNAPLGGLKPAFTPMRLIAIADEWAWDNVQLAAALADNKKDGSAGMATVRCFYLSLISPGLSVQRPLHCKWERRGSKTGKSAVKLLMLALIFASLQWGGIQQNKHQAAEVIKAAPKQLHSDSQHPVKVSKRRLTATQKLGSEAKITQQLSL